MKGRVGRGTAFADFDNNGDVDVLVVNKNDRPVFLLNDGGNRRNWLAIRTPGRDEQSGRDRGEGGGDRGGPETVLRGTRERQLSFQQRHADSRRLGRIHLRQCHDPLAVGRGGLARSRRRRRLQPCSRGPRTRRDTHTGLRASSANDPSFFEAIPKARTGSLATETRHEIMGRNRERTDHHLRFHCSELTQSINSRLGRDLLLTATRRSTTPPQFPTDDGHVVERPCAYRVSESAGWRESTHRQ